MKNILFILSLSVFIILGNITYAQNKNSIKNIGKTTPLFQSQDPLSVHLKFSIKNVKKNTNDSTYMTSTLLYKNKSELWDSLNIKLRARGNNRRDNCYYVPLKLKLKKSITKGTLFEGNKKLKVVLPCLIETNNDDYIVKEYMAYKLYEIISPIHFKTRLVNVEFLEEKRQRTKNHKLKGILIEDIDNVAKRVNGNEIKRRILPLQQDDKASIQYCLFQYLIANTDFSTKFGHNGKLLFVDKKIIPVPYDFDMTGLVNPSYGVVSNIQNINLNITEVSQRAFKGFKRDKLLYETVRKEFISHKPKMFEVIDTLEDYFQNHDQFLQTKNFVADFFKIIENNKKFKKNILDRARVK
jgi:hypothetical protein